MNRTRKFNYALLSRRLMSLEIAGVTIKMGAVTVMSVLLSIHSNSLLALATGLF